MERIVCSGPKELWLRIASFTDERNTDSISYWRRENGSWWRRHLWIALDVRLTSPSKPRAFVCFHASLWGKFRFSATSAVKLITLVINFFFVPERQNSKDLGIVNDLFFLHGEKQSLKLWREGFDWSQWLLSGTHVHNIHWTTLVTTV